MLARILAEDETVTKELLDSDWTARIDINQERLITISDIAALLSLLAD